MKKTTKIIAAVVGSALIMGSLSACLTESEDLQGRDTAQDQNRKDSLELDNLKKKVDQENDPTAVRYVYLLNYGTIFGYYVAEGKVSSSASQIAPEQDLIKLYESSTERYTVDSAKDDGSYGEGDPGIFFFTPEGIMVETSLDYIISTEPIAIDVPRLQAAQ